MVDMPTKKRNLYQRLLDAMEDVRYVQKEKGKDGELKFTIVTHDAVTALCRGALMRAGVYAFPVIDKSEFSTFKGKQWRQGQEVEVEYAALTLHISMIFVNADNPDERLHINAIGIGVDKIAQQDKCPLKALSYAVKSAYLKGLALETGDEAESDYEQSRGESIAPAPLPDVTAPYSPKTTTMKSDVPTTRPALAWAALQPVSSAPAMLNACADALAAQYGRDVKAVRKECKQLLKSKYPDVDIKSMSVEDASKACDYLASVFVDAESAAAKEIV